MHDAGYDIKEAIKFWQNMKKLKGAGSSNSFFSTHPSDDERIKHISQIVAKINR
jgi:Zn-dependent protease with chaperone function